MLFYSFQIGFGIFFNYDDSYTAIIRILSGIEFKILDKVYIKLRKILWFTMKRNAKKIAQNDRMFFLNILFLMKSVK